MEKRRPIGVTIFTLLVLAFGVITTYFAIIGMRLFPSGLFKNLSALKLVWILLPFGILYIASGIGISFLKQWGRKTLLITSPFILIIYIFLIIVKGIDIRFMTILYVLMPILFLYYFTRLKVKEQFK